MRRLFTHRDARIYIAGQSLSVVGDSALWLAMAHLGQDPHRQQQRGRADLLRVHLRVPGRARCPG